MPWKNSSAWYTEKNLEWLSWGRKVHSIIRFYTSIHDLFGLITLTVLIYGHIIVHRLEIWMIDK